MTEHADVPDGHAGALHRPRREPHERRAVALACACNFVLLASYYMLRPVRDTVATVFGADRLQQLFTVTFICTVPLSLAYTALASRVRLVRLVPAAFWFWFANIALFAILLRLAPDNRPVEGAYFVWSSVANLFMISLFWSLMVDVFTPAQATSCFGAIAAGGAIGAIAGPLATRLFVSRLGLDGMLWLAAAGFALYIGLVHLLMREKSRLRLHGLETQRTTLDESLQGSTIDGFLQVFQSQFVRNQAAFMVLMTFVNTVAYFIQTDVIGRRFAAIAARAEAIADIDLVVNVCTAAILVLGLGRIVRRFGVTAGLVLNPVLMVIAFVATALSPTLLMVQGLQVVRRVAQYAIARPSREICFTVVEQGSRYKAKNVVDTVIYRFGDVSSAWVQVKMRALGLGLAAAIALGVAASVAWGTFAVRLGRRFEEIRAEP